jgi:hypothetical protein
MTAVVHKQNNGPMKSRKNTQKTQWAKFTYIGHETRFITKLFKFFDNGISFTTRNNINTLLIESNNLDNKYNRCRVYQLTCTECNKKYIRQTRRPFHVQYKEHAHEYTHNGNEPNFAKHLDHQQALCPMEDCITVIHTISNSPMMNTIEKFHIYIETINNQLNRSTIMHNAIFETLLRNSSDETIEPKHNPTFTRPSVTH